MHETTLPQPSPETTAAPPPRTSIGTLHETIPFTDADLYANRDRRLSDGQRARLTRAWNRLAGFGAVAFIAVVLIASWLFFQAGREENGLILSILGGSLTVVNALIVARLAQSRIRLNQDLRGAVTATHGTVTHTVKVYNRAATYLIEIDGERLLVPKAVFFAFEERAPYVLYRSAATRVLLAAEKLPLAE
ncbi:MAG: hypothetical protein SF162_12375 [bacterium]|nr:hypothetical protein [bacterium]